MDLSTAIVMGLAQLFEAGVERSTILTRVAGVPAEELPGVLDKMWQESKARRDATIQGMPEDK